MWIHGIIAKSKQLISYRSDYHNLFSHYVCCLQSHRDTNNNQYWSINCIISSLGEPLGYKGVEAQEIYDRTISTAMLGLAYLINTLQSDLNNEVLSQYESLLGISFWVKNITNTTPSVRRAVFTLLLAVIQRLPFMINQNIQKFYDFMIKTLQVKDPSDIYITTITEFFKTFPLEESNLITAANANVFKESLCAFIRAGCVRDPLVILNLCKALPEKVLFYSNKKHSWSTLILIFRIVINTLDYLSTREVFTQTLASYLEEYGNKRR